MTVTADTADSLRTKARAWAEQVRALHNTRVPPDLIPQKQRLLNQAQSIRASIEKVFGTIDELEKDGMQIAFLPALVWLGVSGAAAAMTKWSTDAYKLSKEVEAREALEAEVGSERAAEIAREQFREPSWFEKFIGDPKKIIVPLGFGALAVWYFTRKK